MRWARSLVLASILCATTLAHAQESGGSFGGGDFGGGGGGEGGGGGGGFSGGGGSSSWDFGSSGSSGTATGTSSPWGLFCTLAFVIAVGLAIKSARRRGSGGSAQQARQWMASIPPSPQAFVSALQLAVDWRERATLQSILAQLAASGDLKTRAGLDRLLDSTLGELGRRQEAIRLAGYLSESFTSLHDCETRFRQIAAAERGRFQREVVRGEAEGVVRDDEGRFVASSEEGGGFVVITIVVAARKQPPASGLTLDRAALAQIANALASNTPDTMLALEVIWVPATEQDRMSSAEMQALFPHLRAVDPHHSAAGVPDIGRVQCTYCGAVFAAELGACAQCGAKPPRST